MSLIALFARSNHPQGYGFGPYPGEQQARAHGYVVVGIRCENAGQEAQVREYVAARGIESPDKGRIIFPDGRPEREYDAIVSAKGVQRWYSGGAHDFDYLGTIEGRMIPPDSHYETMRGSRGDNRFFWIYDADEILEERG